MFYNILDDKIDTNIILMHTQKHTTDQVNCYFSTGLQVTSTIQWTWAVWPVAGGL